jgi:hypothetical protein
MLTQYIRDGKTNRKVGVMIAKPSTEDDNMVIVGWSKCCDKDRFSRDRGKKIAEARCVTGTCAIIPPDIEDDLIYFVERVQKYYQEKEVIISGIPMGVEPVE